MKLTAESTVVNDGKLNTNIDNAQNTANNAQTIANDARTVAVSAQGTAETALDKANGSVVTDTLHYLATSQSSGVTTSTAGWTTTVQAMTATNKYLWTYHTYTKANGSSVNTTPVITGTYGEKGDQGDQGAKGDTGAGVSSVQPEYYLSTSATSLSGGSWSTSLTYVSGKYIWTRDKVTYSNSTSNYSTAIYNGALTSACANAQSALQIANDTAQYFWFTSSGSDTGAHISEKTQAQFVSNPSGGNLLARSNGIAVRDGLEELATFGANGLQIGKGSEKHITITSDTLNVCDDNGIAPFSVSTANSSKTATVTRYTSISGTSGTYYTFTTQIHLRGTVQNNYLYVSIDTTKPTSFSTHITIPTSGTTTTTISNVTVEVTRTSTSTVSVKFTNTVNTLKYIGMRYTETYKETSVDVNGSALTPKLYRATVIDTTGTTHNAYAFTYGNVCMLGLEIYNTASTDVGGILYRATLLDFIPKADTKLIGLYGSDNILVGKLSSDGSILLNNTGKSSITISQSGRITLTATYIYE